MEQVKATCVFVEQEVEYEVCLIMDVVNHRLKSIEIPQGTPRIELWKTPFYDVKAGSLLIVFANRNFFIVVNHQLIISNCRSRSI